MGVCGVNPFTRPVFRIGAIPVLGNFARGDIRRYPGELSGRYATALFELARDQRRWSPSASACALPPSAIGRIRPARDEPAGVARGCRQGVRAHAATANRPPPRISSVCSPESSLSQLPRSSALSGGLPPTIVARTAEMSPRARLNGPAGSTESTTSHAAGRDVTVDLGRSQYSRRTGRQDRQPDDRRLDPHPTQPLASAMKG